MSFLTTTKVDNCGNWNQKTYWIGVWYQCRYPCYLSSGTFNMTSLLSEISELETALNTLRMQLEAQNKIYQAGNRYLRVLKDG